MSPILSKFRRGCHPRDAHLCAKHSLCLQAEACETMHTNENTMSPVPAWARPDSSLATVLESVRHTDLDPDTALLQVTMDSLGNLPDDIMLCRCNGQTNWWCRQPPCWSRKRCLGQDGLPRAASCCEATLAGPTHHAALSSQATFAEMQRYSEVPPVHVEPPPVTCSPCDMLLLGLLHLWYPPPVVSILLFVPRVLRLVPFVSCVARRLTDESIAL